MADYEADRVVVELLAKADNFDRPIVQSVTKFEGGMDRITAAATKAEGAVSGSTKRMSTAALQASTAMHRGYSDLGNLLTSDKSPFVIPVKQAPAVASAMKYVQAGAAALGGVMGGLLVTGALAAADALASYILKGESFNAMVADMLEKLKEDARKTAAAREAKEQYRYTLEGVTEATRANQEAIEALNRANDGAAEKAAKAAALNLIITEQTIQQTQALVDNARAILEVQRARASGPGQGAELAALNLPERQQALDELEARLGRLNGQLRQQQGQFATLFKEAVTERAEKAATALGAIQKKYDDQVKAAKIAATAEEARNGALDKQIKLIRAAQKAEEDRYRASQKQTRGTTGLPKVTLGEVEGLVKDVFGAGTRITSTTGGKHAPNSYHYAGQGVDFVPQGGMKAFDKEMLRLAAEARGIKVIELLGPGDKGHSDHGHIAFSKTRQGPDQIAAARERQARTAERAADSEERRVQAYENEQANLDGQVIDARQALLTSAEQIADFELAAIEISRKKYNDNLASLVKLDKLHQDEADALQKSNDERARLRGELVKRREDERKFRIQEADTKRAIDLQLGTIDTQRELLESQTGLATTAKARRELEAKLLALQFEMERIQNDAIIADYERLRIKRDLTEAERRELADKQLAAELAAQRNATLPDRQANANSQNNTANAGPLGDFFGSIPDTADEINEALESVAAGGLATFTDALTDAIVNFRSLGDVGRAVLQNITAALVKMAIQQLLLHTVGKLLGKTAAISSATQAGALAAAWAPAAAAASLATLGANAGPAIAAIGATNAAALGFAAVSGAGAAGGFQSGGYTGSGAVNAPAGIVHGQEYVFDAAATRRIGVSNLEALRSGVRPSNAAAAAPGGRSGAGFGADAMGQMQSIVAEAIRAMPPINLFPTYDPVDAFQRAIATPEGRSAMLEFFGDNRGAVNGTLAG